MKEIDPRIVRLTIETDGGLKTFDGLSIYAIGTIFQGSLQNECQVRIYNLKRSTRDWLLAQTSPFNLSKKPKVMYLDVGRESYGTFRIFQGQVVASSPSQPPDIGITLTSLTGFYGNQYVTVQSNPAIIDLESLCRQVAAALNIPLNFQVSQNNLVNIGNYSFSGAARKQVDQLNLIGNISAYIYNDVLIVKDQGIPLPGTHRVLNISNGMIGVPDLTSEGGRVMMLIDNTVQPGGSLTIESIENPGANGTFEIFQLQFELASRDVPFYYIANYRIPQLGSAVRP